MSIQPGTQLGPYEVQEFIGQGAMGFVYKAYHAQLERTGAVKVLQGIAVGPDAVARFRHEAQAIAQMRHPNIVNVYDFGEFDGTPYMIVEYVPGGSLAGKMTQVALDQKAALKYLRGIGAGLDYAHSLGIVHRDVKPANILLEKDGTPVIADFGLVKLLQGSSLQSMSGVTTGTPAYMAPEQVMGRQVGPASDRYSLATMAYEMLTGAIPFEGEGVLELMYAHVHRDPPPPSSRNPGLTLAVDAVIMRGLAKDPLQRWDSCEAFVTALTAALAGQPAPAVERTIAFASPLTSTLPMNSGSTAAATVVEAPPAMAAPTAPVPSAQERRSHKWRWIGSAAGVIILLLLFALCAVIALRPAISLSANPVHAGDTVVVSGSRLPANQVGEVELFSALRTFPFRADGSGNVSVQVIVPRDIRLGDHLVKLCWSNACRVQATLTVLSPVALVTPTSSPSSSASSSSSSTPPSTPTSSPAATSHPTPSTAPGPSNNPSPIPKPTPTPTRPPTPRPTPTPTPPPPPPSPTPTPAPSLTLVSVSSLGNTVATFHYFYGGTATVAVCQSGTCHPAGTVTVAPGGDTTVTLKTPTGILPILGQAYVTTTSGLKSNSVPVGT